MSKRYMKRCEFNAIIAGLRMLQENKISSMDHILDDGLDSSSERIDDEGIDQLIEDLQFDDVQLHIEGT